jgi:hypothetical protein
MFPKQTTPSSSMAWDAAPLLLASLPLASRAVDGGTKIVVAREAHHGVSLWDTPFGAGLPVKIRARIGKHLSKLGMHGQENSAGAADNRRCSEKEAD